MPELPEVETVKRSLTPLLKKRTIVEMRIHYAGVIKNFRRKSSAILFWDGNTKLGRRGNTCFLI